MITTKITNETTSTIQGPAGLLELAYAEPTSEKRNALGIVCHPHPLHGGTMNNKIVTTLAKMFHGLGLFTVRFNFRGVGKSEGRFDQGQGELEDLLAVIDWVQREKNHHEIWLSGFSFGASIALKAATQLPIHRLIAVAPPVDHFAMRSLPPVLCPWILVQGEKDDVVPAEAVLAWAEHRQPKPHIIRFKEAGHFFHGQLTELRVEIENALRLIA